jgi:hypothetical protein
MSNGNTQDFANQLISGYWIYHDPYHPWLDEPRHFSSIYVSYDVSGLTAHGQDLFRQAAQNINSATGLVLYEANGGQIGIDDEFSTFAGSYEPNADWNQHPAIIISGHINMPSNWDQGQTPTESLHDAEHELLHAIGLGHPGNYDENANSGVLFSNDNSSMTIMSYFGPKTSTLGPADILAVRELYGLAPIPPHWSQSVAVGSYPDNSTPLAGGDFNRDGTSDVAWVNSSTNNVDIWLLSGSHWAGSSNVGTHPLGWNAAASGDFDGDGTSDIGWFNPSNNDFDFWKISGAHWAGSTDIGAHPAGYTPITSGDFNHDGTSDIVWFNPSNGNIDIWLLQNGHWAGSFNAGYNPGWQPTGASDYNHDGYADITWVNPSTNETQAWFMQGSQLLSSAPIGSHPMGSTASGTGDFNADGTPDIAWYTPSNHSLETWLLAPTLL